MSTWQSFFNQLSKPAKEEETLISEEICSCNTGKLEFSGKSYTYKGNCNFHSACCAIQIDKHQALKNCGYVLNSCKSQNKLTDDQSNCVFSLEAFLKR